MASSTITEGTMDRSEALLLGVSVGGLIYKNRKTGVCTIDAGEVLHWLSSGEGTDVCGYYTFEWNGESAQEVWHHIEKQEGA